MQVDAYEHQVVGDAIYDAPVAAFTTRQASELAVGVVERVGADVKRHAHDIDAEIPIIIEVARNDAADPCKQCHGCRRHFQSSEKLGEPEPYRPVKVKIENSLYLTRLIGGRDARLKRYLCVWRLQVMINLLELNARADWNDEARMTNDELMSKLECEIL
jgi:hypothetical protein